jgi:hypothetical protein
VKLTIRRIKLDRGGYDERGMYWGVGERLYSCDEAEEAREGIPSVAPPTWQRRESSSRRESNA